MKGIVIKPGDSTIMSIAELKSGNHKMWVDSTVNGLLGRVPGEVW